MGVPQALAGVRLLDVSPAQDRQDLPPLRIEIERQRQRLGSAEVEERRDALMRLRALQHPEASRAALSALNDPSSNHSGYRGSVSAVAASVRECRRFGSVAKR